MSWLVTVVANVRGTLRSSRAKPKRFCAATCSGASLTQVTRASATLSTGLSSIGEEAHGPSPDHPHLVVDA